MTTTRTGLDTSRPFSRADALAAGLDPKLLRGSRFRRIFRGVYVGASAPDSPVQRAEAALVPFRGKAAFASHATAGRIHQVPLPALPDEHVTVLDPRDRRTLAGIRVHLAERAQTTQRSGIRVSSYPQMFLELGTLLTLVDLVVVGDNLVRRGLTTPEALAEFVASRRHAGARVARQAAALVRRKVDSPMETRLRLLLVLAGLPEPEVNREIRAHDGEVLRKYDLSYPSIRVIVEYDGRAHIEREEQWESDLTRREAIDDSGWRILVVTSRGIYSRPQETVMRVWRLARSRGLAGTPGRPKEDWRAHFPGRA